MLSHQQSQVVMLREVSRTLNQLTMPALFCRLPLHRSLRLCACLP